MTIFGQDWLFSDWKKHSVGRQGAFADCCIPILGQERSYFNRGITNLGQERLCLHKMLVFLFPNTLFMIRFDD